MDDFSGDKREPWTVFKALLKRYAALDNLSTLDALKEELQRFPEDMSKDEIISLISEVLEDNGSKRLPTTREMTFLAKTVHCLPEDLHVSYALTEPVIVRRFGKGAVRENKS